MQLPIEQVSGKMKMYCCCRDYFVLHVVLSTLDVFPTPCTPHSPMRKARTPGVKRPPGYCFRLLSQRVNANALNTPHIVFIHKGKMVHHYHHHCLQHSRTENINALSWASCLPVDTGPPSWKPAQDDHLGEGDLVQEQEHGETDGDGQTDFHTVFRGGHGVRSDVSVEPQGVVCNEGLDFHSLL